MMNLAEIRKKAQQESTGKKESADSSPAVSDAVEPEAIEPEVVESAAVEPEEEELTYEAAETFPDDFVAPSRDVIEPALSRASGEAPASFDPLTVLLAGRESSFVDTEAPEGGAATYAAGGDEFQEFLCFRVSTEIYAINIMSIKEIIKPREVTEIPRAPGFVAGVLSLRGIIIPVFNMRERLGLAAADTSGRARIIVVKKGDEFIGIVVDEVTQVVRISAASIEKPPAVLDGIDRDFVSGIGRADNQMVILLNQEKILDITLG